MGWRTGVRLTNLAAEFWILCNLEICVSDKPYNKLLQKSIRGIIRAWTNFSVAAWLRNCLRVPILWSAKDAALHILLTCLLIVRNLSIVTPRFLAVSTVAIVDDPRKTESIWGHILNLLVKWRISVLSSFSFMPLLADHSLISETHDWSLWIADDLSLFLRRIHYSWEGCIFVYHLHKSYIECRDLWLCPEVEPRIKQKQAGRSPIPAEPHSPRECSLTQNYWWWQTGFGYGSKTWTSSGQHRRFRTSSPAEREMPHAWWYQRRRSNQGGVEWLHHLHPERVVCRLILGEVRSRNYDVDAGCSKLNYMMS